MFCRRHYDRVEGGWQARQAEGEMMRIVPAKCPCCGAHLGITRDRRYWHCAHCGSNLIVSWNGAPYASLITFESVLTGIADATSFVAADRRLSHLEKQIAQGRRVVASQARELARARAACAETKKRMRRAHWTRLAYATGAGLLGTILLPANLLRLGHPGWGWWLILTLLLFGAAAYNLYEWWTDRCAAPIKLQSQAQRIDETGALLTAWQSRLEDHLLERELCLQKVASYRYTGDLAQGNSSHRA